MNCPILMLKNSPFPADHKCIENQCAIWDSVNERCAITTIAKALDSIDNRGVVAHPSQP